MRAAKVDANHATIVNALRLIGYTVQSLAAVGKGCPDLLVGGKSRSTGRPFNALFEIKDGNEKLTEHQVKWHSEWRGQVCVVRSIDEAFAVMEMMSR